MTNTAGDAAQALPEAFYLRDGDGVYRTTSAAQGPWDPGTQHGGPPAALLATAIEEQTARPDLRVARVTVDFLGPIPLGVLNVTVKILRPGRRVQLAGAELTHDGKLVAVARTWQHAVATAPGKDPDMNTGTDPGTDTGATEESGGPESGHAAPPLPPEKAHGSALFAGFGYGRAIEWRATAGSIRELGPAAVWARPRVPLVAGTAMTGLQRALVVADSANGISLSLPLDRFLSMPTSLNVAFLRHPAGEWVHLDARTEFSGDGVGLTSARLADRTGLLATIAQPLLVAPRG